MGNKLDLCGCNKHNEETGIEVELNSGEKRNIKIFKHQHKFSINKTETQKSSQNSTKISKLSKLSDIKNNSNNISIFSEKSYFKPFIKDSKKPEIIIQSLFRGSLYRNKFKVIDGIKQKLINENFEIINKVEKNFIPKSLIKAEKLFINSSFEDNWKKYYPKDINSINDLLPKIENIDNNKKNYLIKTKCLLSKYKNKVCLYKGTLHLNDFKKNKNSNNWNINSLTGKGVLYLKVGKKYEGNFLNGELNGWCRFINSKGVCYEGLFISGILNGKGEIIKIDQNRRRYVYKGGIINFKKEGKGKEKTNLHAYEGEFLNDLKHGKGKIYYNNTGDFYEGDFTKGEITGKGFYVWSNKHSYFGDFECGKMHGRGVYKWTDGNEYEGEYINNIKEGEGVFKWKDGKTYKGPFVNGRPHGKGVLTVNGLTFDAIFENGRYLGDYQLDINSSS